MDDNTKRKMMVNYFKPFPKFSIWLILIGLVVAIIGGATEAGAGVIIIGIILLGLGILIIVMSTKGKATDQQMDKWLNEMFETITKKNALDKLGIDESELTAETLFIPGPVYWGVQGFDQSVIKRKEGKDKYYRYSTWNIEVFLMTENYLANYGCTFNMIKNTSINEHTNEFFYKDVVSVRTATESSAYTLLDGHKLEQSQMFQLNLAGDSVRVVTDDANLKVSSAMSSRVDKTVQAIRTMLRQKKA
ncbi:MAG: hypothetical protein K9N09_07590 [Candidatus Cloacimonetes bacterium]|nr:hypothetical protein [Candidatus Cloacimonadota bacterium]MCF8357077.1 hypothetical protein [Melioribacteraceae bacterium]